MLLNPIQLLHPMIDPKPKVNVIAKGPASPGAAVGKVVFTAQDAEEWAARGEKVILVRLGDFARGSSARCTQLRVS